MTRHNEVLLKRYTYNGNYPDKVSYDHSWVELKSSTGKTFRFDDDPNQQELSAFPVFKNVIIQKLEEYCINDINSLEERLMKIFKLAEYIDADEITMAFNHRNKILLNKELWKYFDFGKKTEINFRFYAVNSTNDFFKNTFKEFISGKYMEHPKLNELQIYFDEIDRHVIFHLIVETFCNTDEPLKFFKSIATLPPANFDEIFGEFGFISEDRKPKKYRLSHPKLKWILEAKQPSTYGFQLKPKSVE